MKQRFAIIDWLQSTDSDCDRVRINARLNKYAKRENLETESLKSVCIRDYQYTYNTEAEPKSDKLKGMKTRGRNNYTCDCVLVITDNPTAYWNKNNIEKWADRVNDIRVMDISKVNPHFTRYETFEQTHRLSDEVDEDDVFIEKWFRAFGIELSAPPILNYNGKEYRENAITERAKRPHDSTQALRATAGENHITKTRTNPETFLEQERCVYTETEKAEAKAKINFLLDAIDNGTMSESEAMDIDYIMCPYTHGKARDRHATRIKRTEGVCYCDICGREIEPKQVITEPSSQTFFYHSLCYGKPSNI